MAEFVRNGSEGIKCCWTNYNNWERSTFLCEALIVTNYFPRHLLLPTSINPVVSITAFYQNYFHNLPPFSYLKVSVYLHINISLFYIQDNFLTIFRSWRVYILSIKKSILLDNIISSTTSIT